MNSLLAARRRFGAQLLASSLSVSILLLSVAPAFAATIQTDLWVYNDGDTVTVTGDGFGADETVELVSTDPDGVEVDRGTAQTDASGNLVYQFILRATVGGIYDINATGLTSGLTAWTQFDPPSVSITSPTFAWYRTQTGGFDVSISGSWGCSNPCISAQSLVVDVFPSDNSNNTVGGVAVASRTLTSLSGNSWATTFQFRTAPGAGQFAIPSDQRYDVRATLNYNSGSTTAAIRDHYFGVDNTPPTSSITSVNPNASGGKLVASGTAADTASVGGAASGLVGGRVYVEIRQATASGTAVTGSGQNVSVSGAGAWSYTNNSPPTATGTYCVVSIATDNAGNVQDPIASSCYVVGTVNTAPTISDIADQTIDEDDDTGALAFTVGDGQTAASSLLVSGSSSNTTLVPNANIVFGGSGANRTVTVTPVGNGSGASTVTVTVSDGELQASDTFLLTVNAVNDAPTISDVADQTISEDGDTGALAFTVGDAETDASSLIMAGTSSDTTLVPNDNIVFGGTGASRTVTVTPASDASGTSTITLTVSDGSLQNSDTFLLTVNAVNDAPTISDVEDQEIDEDGDTGVLNFKVADAETPPSSLQVTGSSSNTTLVPNANITFGTPTAAGANRTVTVSPAANESGTSTITITVSDGSLSASDSFLLTVNAVNDAPVCDDPQADETDEDVDITDGQVTCDDVDGDSLSFTLGTDATDGDLTLNADGSFTYEPDDDFNGSDSFTFTADDGSGESNSESNEATVNITVNAVNDAPAVSSDQSSAETVDYSDAITDVTITATDVDSAQSTLSASTQWKLGSGAWQNGLPAGLGLGSPTCDTVAGVAECSWTLSGTTDVRQGSYTIRVTVEDDDEAAESTDVLFNVTREDARTEYSGGTIAQTGQTITLRATVWDSAAASFGAGGETGASATIGDIEHIWIKFSIYGASSCGGSPTAVRYAQVADTGTADDGIGTASATYSSSSESTYCVDASIVAGNTGGVNDWYAGPASQGAVITFYTPSGQFVTGGGWMWDPAGGKGNMGFNARLNKSGKPQGQLVYVWRGVYSGPCTIAGVAQTCANVPVDFVVKSNALTAFGFTNAQSATLEGKATLQVNRQSDGATIFSDGGATFSARAYDSGVTTGAGDTFGLTVYDKNGVMYRSIPATAMQGGNLVVKSR